MNALYRAIRASARELKTLTFIGPKLLVSSVTASDAAWQSELPVQSALEWSVEREGAGAPLTKWLARADNEHEIASGNDSLYLPPDLWAKSPLAPLAARYPAGCGLKIGKATGGVAVHYNIERFGRKLQRALSYSFERQLLVYNFLHLNEVAPRLYDLVELSEGGNAARAAFVVQHIDADTPDQRSYEEAVQRLRALRDSGRIQLISPGGWKGIDFEPPGCNGNLLRCRQTGVPYYVDVHNFVLVRYGSHLRELARSVGPTSHFGNQSMLLGKNYLYQEIPGVALPAKRSPRNRMESFDALLAEAQLDLHEKVVLDVGCNLGLMSAECLRRGARWVHGWDLPEVVDAARRTLLAVGCTRFSLTPASLSREYDLAAALPNHIADTDPANTVVGYFAVREHLGWLPALRSLPWRYMLYEGHQHDEPLEAYMAELQALVPCRVLAQATIRDANTLPRTAAVIERLDH